MNGERSVRCDLMFVWHRLVSQEDSIAALISGLDGSEEIWEADESEMTADEVDGSITVNTLPIRRKMNESLQQSLVESPLDSCKSPGKFLNFCTCLFAFIKEKIY